MERIKLSKNIGYVRYLVLFIGVVFILVSLLLYNDTKTATAFPESGFVIPTFVLPLFGLVPVAFFAIFSTFFFKKVKAVEFDAEYMYLGKDDQVETISLANVTEIKETIIKVNYDYVWKIKYRDIMGSVDFVRVLPKNGTLAVFKNTVSSKNPALQISKSARFLDFDL